MTFEIKVSVANADEVLSVKDMKTTLYFKPAKNETFYGQVDDKLEPHIFVLHLDFIPTKIKKAIEEIIASSKTMKDVSLKDVVIAPASHRFLIGSKVVLDIRYRGKLVGTYDPDFKLRSIKKQRLSKKFKRAFNK